jgi:hypothetical protein
MLHRFRARKVPARFLLLCLLLANLAGQWPGSPSPAQAAPAAFARPEFERLWQKTDGPVSAGAATRSWLWGPAPGLALDETYAQSRDGVRNVQYFDKARMELNPAVTDDTSPWRVTTGLLVSEMVEGRIQTGDKQFVVKQPADDVVAGDGGSAENPRYSDFTLPARQKAANRTGELVTAVLTHTGLIEQDAPRDVHVATFVRETAHNIPDVFWTYLNQTGPVRDAAGHVVQETLFDWVYVLGYPVAEPYWVKIKVGGKPYTALVQLFQRRTLTYVSDFPEAWRVQMGNVGQHYYTWRYSPTPSTQPQSPTQPAATPTAAPRFPATGGFVGIDGGNFVYAGSPVKLKGTNYWLHDSPFVSTWSEWDGPQALAELKKAHELGVNTIRVGIPFNHSATQDMMWDDDASMAKVSDWIKDEMTQFLQVASIYGMKVIFVLFEWYDEYPTEHSRQERTNLAYLEGIVGSFASDDRVLAWDLHNEPDKYGEWQGGNQSKVIKWLQRMASAVRYLDQRHPITVGVGDYSSLWYPASDGTTLLSFVDIAAFHCYDAGALSGQIAEIKQHTTRPIFLEEMGWPTASGDEKPPPGATFNEETQNFLYRAMLGDSKAHDIAGVVQWTLWDYTPRSTTGGRTASYEEHFGLVRTDGSFKPAAAIFQNDYAARDLPSNTKTHLPLTPADKRNSKP